ncbi:MAG TPA: ABC transporter transmembrane domain-containing protein [Hypericibacter adhaerens]|uniref:ABC transporter ATP-binding protein n=1 Tax=Hypericibacter adhaerens TaxID=2602016 RepID=UPI002B9DF988|nr:ABC transporter transmembrane domain-containing protein [Hypericibacter adhaerens]HWA43579.1 ABC transporter transmembrane domain-containing protein [Hypericibacter adhaerens]
MRRLLADHVRPELPRLAAALICMAIVSAATAALAWQMQPILDRVFGERDLAALRAVAIGTFAIFAVKGFASYGQSVLMIRMGLAIVCGLQKRLFRHVVGADLVFFHDRAPGDLVSRVINDCAQLRDALSTLLTNIGKDALTLVGLVAVMFYQDWFLALIAFIVIPVAVLPIARVGRRVRRLAKGTQQETGGLATLLDEVFHGARQVKAYGMEAAETARADAAVDRLFRLQFKSGRTRSALQPVMELLGGAAIVAVMLYGGHQVVEGARSPGAFFSFITAVLLAYEPLKRLANVNAAMQAGLGAADRIFALIDMEPGVTDRPGAKALAMRGGAIRLERVSFAYGGADAAPALDGVDIDVPAGATVALVGPSGAGKSTVFNLIPRFFDPQSGRVLVDGQDVRELTLASLRRSIALVSQDVLLFDDSIRANILYGRPEATEAEVIEAAKAAQAWDFIEALPQGLDMMVGPRGAKLSGGQRQRIAIARAMLRNAPILLLDEATSNLDPESERAVQTALARLMRGRTTLVIAHRLATVAAADCIYVLEQGRVVERGPHPELLALNGTYARLHALQFRDGPGDGEANADIPAEAPPAERRRQA